MSKLRPYASSFVGMWSSRWTTISLAIMAVALLRGYLYGQSQTELFQSQQAVGSSIPRGIVPPIGAPPGAVPPRQTSGTSAPVGKATIGNGINYHGGTL